MTTSDRNRGRSTCEKYRPSRGTVELRLLDLRADLRPVPSLDPCRCRPRLLRHTGRRLAGRQWIQQLARVLSDVALASHVPLVESENDSGIMTIAAGIVDTE